MNEQVGNESGSGSESERELPSAVSDVDTADRMVAVRATHEVLTAIREHVRGKFGVSVGPVLVTSVTTEEEDNDPELRTDSFQIWFKIGTQQITLTVPTTDLEQTGTEAIDRSYDRLMGKSRESRVPSRE